MQLHVSQICWKIANLGGAGAGLKREQVITADTREPDQLVDGNCGGAGAGTKAGAVEGRSRDLSNWV